METVLEQLRQRQIAAEQEKTFEIQKTTASKRRELAEEQARADQQPEVTKSELSIRIADNAGRAEAARQTRLADGIRVTAEAEAYSAKVRAEAIGGTEGCCGSWRWKRWAKAVRDAQMPLVPSTLVEGSGDGGNNLLGLLLAMVKGGPQGGVQSSDV